MCPLGPPAPRSKGLSCRVSRLRSLVRGAQASPSSAGPGWGMGLQRRGALSGSHGPWATGREAPSAATLADLGLRFPHMIMFFLARAAEQVRTSQPRLALV